MIDLHTHVLPGLDDGPRDMDASLDLCRSLIGAGTRTVVATPHMLKEGMKVSQKDIREGVFTLKERLAVNGLDLQVKPGAEVHLDDNLCRLVEERRVMTLADQGRHVLIELPYDILPPGLDHYLFSLTLAGIDPVLAHPERNLEVQRDPEKLIAMVSAGVLLQVTAGSFFGDFGRSAYQCAGELLQLGMVHLVASDAHTATQETLGLDDAFDLLKKNVGLEEAKAVFHEQPARILAGERIEVPEIRSKPSKGFLKKMGKGRASQSLKGDGK